MFVLATCNADSWDSPSCTLYKRGQTYEIKRDGQLAKLKGPRGEYVFEFDRNAGPDDKPHDYSCKREGCGKKFKTLNELGTHTREDHKDEPHPLAEPDADVVVAIDQRGKGKGRSFTCKTPGCGVVVPNLHELKMHKKTHVEDAATDAA